MQDQVGRAWTITRCERRPLREFPRRLVALPRGSEDIVWAARDLVISSNGSKLVSWKPGTPDWQDVVDLGPFGLSRLSRLAVSQDGKWLAIVAAPAP